MTKDIQKVQLVLIPPENLPVIYWTLGILLFAKAAWVGYILWNIHL